MDGALQSYLHLLVAAVQAGLVAVAGRAFARGRRWESLVVTVVLLGLTYDNAVLGLGRFVGHGDTLEGLSYPRFVLHALTTPLLIVVGLGAATAAGHAWARVFATRFAVWSLTSVMVAWGVITDIVRLRLAPVDEAGVVSYSNAAGTFPVPAVVTILALLAFGALLWSRPGWPWLEVGALAMLVASFMMSSGLLVNLGELALGFALVATELRAAAWEGRRGGVSLQVPARL